jgi:dnd system-associated protein 4
MKGEKDRDSVRIDVDKKKVFEDLKGPRSPFENEYDVFIAAACFGFNNGIRLPINTGKAHSPFKRGNFDKQKHEPFLYALALAETGDEKVLGDWDNVLTIAEEYANGGIDDLYEQTLGQAGGAVNNLIDIMLKKLETSK